MTTSARGGRRSSALARRATFDPGTEIEQAEATAIVMWRGARIPYRALPERMAATDDRAERDALLSAWSEALEAINPLYEARLARWKDAARAAGSEGVIGAAASSAGRDLEAVALELEQLAISSETIYHAALRRHLALIDIEQGDGTIGDLWHITRGAAWNHWFDRRAFGRAAAESGRSGDGNSVDGWLTAEDALAAPVADTAPARAVGELMGSLVGDPAWLSGALRMADAEIAPFADFVAFVRLWRLRRLIGLTHYELRLYRADEPAIQRAYYAGIVGHMTGILVPEAAYLADVGVPFGSVVAAERTMLAGAIGETVATRFGPRWWAEPEARDLVETIGRMPGAEDALAQLGYDSLDWRPVLRQIRTRLIGEMSGYGGPNITTRAGTRKV